MIDGVDLKTDTFVSDPGKAAVVKLAFSCHKRILGLEEILDQYSHTRPGVVNIQEWEAISDSIIRSTTSPASAQFKDFVTVLGQTKPGLNQAEWAKIRMTCVDILRDWDNADKQLLFKMLLERFAVTKPGRDNLDEWTAIRNLSLRILSGLKELPWG